MPTSGESTRERADLHLMLVRDIGALIDRSRDFDTALRDAVACLAEALAFEVVSIYLWDAASRSLALRASHGLRIQEGADFRLAPGEGLTGFVFETRQALIAMPASSHPRFRALEGSGELDYESYLGVPIALGTRPLGVLVAQTRTGRPITAAERTLFEIVSARLGGLIEMAAHRSRDERNGNPRVLQGRGVAAGLALGPALRIDGPRTAGSRLSGVDEVQRLQAARRALEDHLHSLIERFERDGRLNDRELDILRFHQALLADAGLKGNLLRRIESGAGAEDAVRAVFDEQAARLRAAPIALLAARGDDLADLRDRLIERLPSTSVSPAFTAVPKGSVVVAEDVGPLLFAALVDADIGGLVTAHGGAASHTAILAQSLGIPAVAGVAEALSVIEDGDPMLVDGRTGLVFHRPDPGVIADFQAQQRHSDELRARLDLPDGDLADQGIPLRLAANVGFPADVDAARRYGLQAAGLARSEFFFLTRQSRPSILEQTAYYSKLAVDFPEGVTIRTLDIGGDKRLPYVDFPVEDNPMLGLRGIRYTMEHLDLLAEQIAAIVGTHCCDHHVRILLPMVSHLWELVTARELLTAAGNERGLAADQLPPLGVMLEAPAMLWQLDEIAAHADFVTVGTNDLAQYLLAVDRGSSVVGHLYTPLHPAVLRALADARRQALRLRLPITVCGELAGRPGGALALAALGYRELSVAPARAPLITHLARHVPATALTEIADAVLAAGDAREVEESLRAALGRFAPLLREFDGI